MAHHLRCVLLCAAVPSTRCLQYSLSGTSVHEEAAPQVVKRHPHATADLLQKTPFRSVLPSPDHLLRLREHISSQPESMYSCWSFLAVCVAIGFYHWITSFWYERGNTPDETTLCSISGEVSTTVDALKMTSADDKEPEGKDPTNESEQASDTLDFTRQETPGSELVPWVGLFFRIGMAFTSRMNAAGVLPIWPVVEPSFAEAGVFGSVCGDEPYGCDAQEQILSFSYLIGFSVMMLSTWPVGLAFDILGPQLCSVYGCLLCCIAQFFLVMTTMMPSTLSWLLFPGSLLASIGGMMQSYCIAGFMWHRPEQQTLVLGLGNSSAAAATIFTMAVLVAFPFKAALWYFFIASVVAVFVCWVYVPRAQEFAAAAMRALGSRPPKSAPFRSKIRACWKCFNVNYADNMYFSTSLLMLLCFYMYLSSIQSPYLTTLLDSATESQMICDTGMSVYGLAGLVLSPICGYLSDKFGFTILMLLVFVLNTLYCTLVFVPDLTAQLISACSGSIFFALYMVYVAKYMALYAPPEHYGSYFGLVFAATGAISMLVCVVMFVVAAMALTGLSFYLVPLAVLAVASTVSTGAFVWHMHGRDFPAAPPVLSDEEDEGNTPNTDDATHQ